MTSTPAFSAWHPAALIATFFGIGKLPFAPGTWGSLATFPLLYGVGNAILLLPTLTTDYDVLSRLAKLMGFSLLFTLFVFIIGAIASHIYVRETHKEDPGEIVIDEVAGQLLTFILILPSVLIIQNQVLMFAIAIASSFILFRLFDIKKPWPIDWCDNNIKGGIGIMVDDIVAALMAVLTHYVILFVILDIIEKAKT